MADWSVLTGGGWEPQAWLPLVANEQIEWETHPRLMRILPAVLVSLGLAAVSIAGFVFVDDLVLVGLFFAVVPTAYAYLRVVNTWFVVTNRALYRKRGVLGRDVRTVELDRVQNTRSSQGILGTTFGYGTVRIEVAGGQDLEFYDVYDPDEVRTLVERLAGRRDQVPGTREQWEAVREELRAIRQLLEADE